jgi:hypothetical protein
LQAAASSVLAAVDPQRAFSRKDIYTAKSIAQDPSQWKML